MRKSTAPNLVLLAGMLLSVAGPGCRPGGDLASKPPYEEAFQRAWFDAQNAWAKNDWDPAYTGFLQCAEMQPEEPSVPFMLGQIDARRNRHAAAVDHFDRALALDGDGYWYHHRRGESLVALGKREAARDEALFCIEARRGDLETAFGWIDAFAQQGWWPEAIACCDRYEQRAGPDVEIAMARLELLASGSDARIYERALEVTVGKFPDEPELEWMWMDWLFRNGGSRGDAYLIQMEQRHPTDPQLHYYRCMKAFGRGEMSQGFAQLQLLMSSPEINPELKCTLFNGLEQLMPDVTPAQRRDLLERLFVTHPGEPQVEALRLEGLSQQGNWEAARSLWLERLQTEAHNRAVWLGLLESERQLGRWQDARQHGLEGVARFPLDPEMHFLLATAHAQLLQYPEAAKAMRQAIELAWDQPVQQARWSGELGAILHELGDGPGSFAALEAAIAGDPLTSAWYNNQAYFLAQRGEELDRALACIEHALLLWAAFDPPANYWDTYAWVLHRRGEGTEALGWIDRALAESPSDPLFLEHRGDILWGLGRPAEAREAWEAARKAGGDAVRLASKPGKMP